MEFMSECVSQLPGRRAKGVELQGGFKIQSLGLVSQNFDGPIIGLSLSDANLLISFQRNPQPTILLEFWMPFHVPYFFGVGASALT